MAENENKASVQHTPAEWTSSNQDQYANADKARYHSEKVRKIRIPNLTQLLFFVGEKSGTSPDF